MAAKMADKMAVKNLNLMYICSTIIIILIVIIINYI